MSMAPSGSQFSSDALREIDRFFKADCDAIIPLTVPGILDEQFARPASF